MKYILITSKGEIDERAFSLVGASTKKDDTTKIGMFGSGLKYSLAFLIRNKIDFRVFSGYREVKFSTAEENFRNNTFKRILVNDKETSLTTDMGGSSDWTHFSIIREIYCNALDESDGSIKLKEYKSEKSIKPIEDYTAFYIKVDDKFQEILDNWDLYFSNNRKDAIFQDDKSNKIFSGGDSTLVYRKGIQCHYVTDTKSLFHYDMSWIKINESRNIKDDWEFKYDLCKFLKKIKDKSIIHRILFNINNFAEKSLYWENSTGFSEDWVEQIGERILIPYENAGMWEDEIKLLKGNYIILPSCLVTALSTYFGDRVHVIGCDGVADSKGEIKILNELTKKQEYLLNEAKKFLNDSGVKIEYPIKVVRFSKPERLGLAKDNKIFLSEKLFTMGTKEIVTTIIEEKEHNDTGYTDESRAFQQHLINLYVGELEAKTGRYL